MPIEHTKTGAVVVTGKGIDLYRWVALLTTLKLQAKTGMRPNRFTNPRAIAKAWLNLKTNNFDQLIAAVEAVVESKRAQVTHVYEVDDRHGQDGNEGHG